MAYRIAWSKSALADLRDLVRDIARDNREAAGRFGNRIVPKAETLGTFPRIGRIVPEFRGDRLREIIITPYRIAYQIDDNAVTLSILRVWHGARGDLELP